MACQINRFVNSLLTRILSRTDPLRDLFLTVRMCMQPAPPISQRGPFIVAPRTARLPARCMERNVFPRRPGTGCDLVAFKDVERADVEAAAAPVICSNPWPREFKSAATGVRAMLAPRTDTRSLVDCADANVSEVAGNALVDSLVVRPCDGFCDENTTLLFAEGARLTALCYMNVCLAQRLDPSSTPLAAWRSAKKGTGQAIDNSF